MDDLVVPVRALLSVSDKTGVADFARVLAGLGVQILSTGGTARLLREAGIAVVDVSAHTGFPEILDGRVKTLVPQIHGGILGRRDDPSHVAQMAAHGIAPIDLVCVNLYPFEASIAAGAVGEAAIEEIDIGGPALIRAAAKNHAHVCVIIEPAQYERVAAALASEGGTRLGLRRALAGEAYAKTAAYDGAIAAWFAREDAIALPARLVVSGRLREALRYGENPHQAAGFYVTDEQAGIAGARQVQGKALSYNNINDTDAAYQAVAEFDEPACVIVKHANPCGVAMAGTIAEAWQAALRCDPTSAFGGIVAASRPIDEAAARAIAAIFTEVIVAPDASEAALAVFAAKKNLRVLLTGGPIIPSAALTFRSVAGGFLAQSADSARVGADDLRVVTRRAPDEAERRDLLFAFRVAKHVKSNAIVLAAGGATVGIGAGQMSRVDSARIAAWKGREAGVLNGPCVAASDAFFPFADGLASVIEAGARAVIQPGGSMRDEEVIAAADEAGIAMVFTGVRHFRH